MKFKHYMIAIIFAAGIVALWLLGAVAVTHLGRTYYMNEQQNTTDEE